MARISDLMLRRGDLEAQRHQTGGQFWGGFSSALASMPGQIQQLQAQQAAAQQAAADAELDREHTRTQTRATADANTRANAEAIDAASARALAARTAKVDQWLTAVAGAGTPDEQMVRYTQGREALTADGTIETGDAPDAFPGLSWVKSRLMMLLPAKDRFAQLFPEQKDPKLVPVTRTEHGTVTTTMQPEAAGLVTSTEPVKPEPLPEQEWVMRGGTVTPIAKGTRQAGDRPVTPPSTAAPQRYDLTGPNGEQRFGVDTAEANRLAGQGWKKYDAAAVRQGNGAPDAEALDTAKEVQRIARSLLSSDGFAGAFGVVDARLPTFRQSTADAETLRDALTALLTLENTGKLKGVLSNADMEILRRASTTISPRMGEAAARDELRRLDAVMAKVTGEIPPDPAAPGAPPPARVNPFRR